jgi:galactokinase
LTAAWSAPGRVNLIGEHTDYNDGFVLPFALPYRTVVTATLSDDPQWTVSSGRESGAVHFDRSDLAPGKVTGWAGYVAGIVWVLHEAAVDVPYARLSVTSDVPVGAGLSSSAALECATLAALVDLFLHARAPYKQLGDGTGPVPASTAVQRARWPELARRAENEYVGMPCGIMDQSAVVRCEAGHALFLDCRSGEAEQVPFDVERAGLVMLVIDTRAPHRLVDGEYAARRATCEAAAAALGVPALRDLTDLPAALSTLDDEIARRRARHVVTENQRVLDTVALLRAGRISEIGPLLTQSHASLRDDFEVTVPELDVAVDAALAAGAHGARMTGGGFGGCAIALVERGRAEGARRSVREAFADNGFRPPDLFVTAADGGLRPA